MQIITATGTAADVGILAKIVNGFSEVHRELVDAGITSISDWEPLAQFVAVDEFKQVGAYLEESNGPNTSSSSPTGRAERASR